MEALNTDIVLHVLSHLHKIITSIPYFLNLRTVSKPFNEAVLHVLFIKSDHPTSRYGPSHSRFITSFGGCRDICRTSVGLWSALASPYAQMYLAGRLVNQRTRCIRRKTLYHHLEEATDILEGIVGCTSLGFGLSQTDIDKFSVLSENGIFKNPARGLICRAAVFFLTNQIVMNEESLLRPSGIEKEHASFWVMNVACYLGLDHFIDYLLTQSVAETFGTTLHDLQRSASKCLAVAIEKGHQQLVDKILELNPMAMAGRTDAPCPLRAAIRACDLTSVHKWLGVNEGSDISSRINDALSDESIDPVDPVRYAEVFKLVWRFTDPSHMVRQSSITINTARIGSVESINFLVANKALSASHLHLSSTGSALTKPAERGHLDTVIALLDGRYFENVNRTRINHAAWEAASAALQNNHLDIFVELSKRLNCFDRPLWFIKLAAADGAIPLMQERLNQDRGMLRQIIKTHETNTEHFRIGQAALEQAINSLKHENVRFLLGLDIRLSRNSSMVTIPWNKYVTYRKAFEATQQVLRSYDIPIFSEAV